ncbi:MAG: deoxyribodipyrimidine photo-lyase [Planctomyces sp.]|nr:deoxyribodipyrimidine photo-lyase [Planctomyces sp.]
MNAAPLLLWLHNDFRLHDHPGWFAAQEQGGAVIPVALPMADSGNDWAPGAASRWWLHHSLNALDRELRERGSRLILRSGAAEEGLLQLVQDSGARGVVWSCRSDPQGRVGDRQLTEALERRGLVARRLNSSLLYPPETISNRQGRPFQVFTPFWKACLASGEPEPPLPPPKDLSPPSAWPESEPLESFGLLPKIPWDAEFPDRWTPGEAGARQALTQFFDVLDEYPAQRNLPAVRGSSRLSPHLHFGEISPRQIWAAVRQRAKDPEAARVYLSEIGWREFAHYILHHFPETAFVPLRSEFREFPWSRGRRPLHAWQQGRTGYPIVDAGMRELWRTGWMHNRVRMIVGSFLTKDLLISWREGARWFWDTLVDADLANNTLGWQWVSGCGADAAPYFRIFNPVLQGKKFDHEGEYVRRWVPELAALETRWIHEPWNAPEDVLAAAGVALGASYPRPIVDHAEARTRALEIFAGLSK